MPEIQAFRGLRYDLGHVGSLTDVVAPPYDVIGPDFQDELYRRHPANVVRLILNREEMGDDDAANRYTRAARFLRTWQREGVLQSEPDPALYVYHQVFQHEGQQFTRRGFMARVRLERFGEGKIYPHEETHAAAKADRLRLINACQANLSQIFGLYPDPENEAQEYLEEVIRDSAPLEATDHLGVVHRMWPVSDLKTVAGVSGVMDAKAMYVADGHHRYETACNYRDQLAADGALPPDHPANFVLTMLVSMNDPGMIVLPTHRLFRGLDAISSQQLSQRLDGCFDIRPAGEGPAEAHAIWSSIEEQDDQGTLALYTAADQQWLLAHVTEAGRAKMAEAARDHGACWQGLGVSILHRLMLDTLLESRDLPKPDYVHLVDEVVDGLSDPEQAGQYALAALVMPATLEHIREISQQGERMPAKSTYFYPKLLSGLVINPVS
jgi:uncharacterized protein (DUF1015 family)